MHNLNIYIILLSSCLLFNCKQDDKTKISIFEKKIYTQNFGIDLNEKITPTKLVSFKNRVLYYFLNYEELILYGYEINTNKLVHKIDVLALKSIISFDRTTQIQWLKEDLIGFFSNDDQKIILIDSTGKIIHQSTTAEEDTEAPYVSVSYFDRTFSYHNNVIYFNKAYTDFVLAEKEDYIKYYSRPVTLSIDLNTGEKHHFLKAPQTYQNGNSYKNFDVYSCSGFNNQIVFSFPSNDSLFICKDNRLEKKVFAGSVKEPQFKAYDISKNKDLSEFRKYNSTKPFYQKIVYDSYQEFYYRVFKLENDYLNSEGKINREYKWSLIVLNNQFKIIGELFFNSENYSPATICPTKKGLIISSEIKQGITKNYTLFDIKISDK